MTILHMKILPLSNKFSAHERWGTTNPLSLVLSILSLSLYFDLCVAQDTRTYYDSAYDEIGITTGQMLLIVGVSVISLVYLYWKCCNNERPRVVPVQTEIQLPRGTLPTSTGNQIVLVQTPPGSLPVLRGLPSIRKVVG